MKNTMKMIPLVLVLALAACDNRGSYIESLNKKPRVYLVDQTGNQLTSDSLKVSSSSSKKTTNLILKLEGNTYAKNVKFSLVSGLVGFSPIFGDSLKGNVEKSVEGTLQNIPLALAANGKGTFKFTASIFDKFDNSSDVAFDVFTFTNMSPIASFKLDKIAVNDPNEYTINGSASYDQDARFGGRIIKYVWSINGKVLQGANGNSVKWIFNSGGNYKIDLTVTDNDGFSNTFSQIFTIN